VRGQASVEIRLAQLASEHDVWFASIQEECILGADFLKEVGCVIDYLKQFLWIDDTEVPIQVGGEEEPRCFQVVLDKTVRIVPFTK
jgi:hypothetical protein